ncbi:MAG: ggtA [Myxococcaceae bacterium]|nr:ggtA [Myxococcaceae bacterium]
MIPRVSPGGLVVVLVLGAAACGSPPAVPLRGSQPAPVVAAATPEVKDAAASNADAAPRAPCDGDDFGLPHEAEADVAARFAKKRGTMGTATKTIVATSHHLATEAGLAVLRSGGNAADAFVAATLVQDVVLPGVTSTAGLSGVLVYEAKSKKLTYVHGGVGDPIDPARRWQHGDTAIGKMVLVPGAPAAYAEIARRFGKKPLATLVEPAAKLATNGFPADALYARAIARSRTKLEKTAYGKKAFYPGGKPVTQGETLKQEELGATLRSYGKDPRWFYKGPWARDAVALAAKDGGTLTVKDFETYAAEIGTPMHARFLERDVYASGHGGAKVLVSLQALELLRAGRPAQMPSASPEALETLLRTQRAVDALPLLHDRDLVTKGPALDAELTKAAVDVAGRVKSGLASKPVISPGTHSSAVIVVDGEGNIVVGTHTIETLNWGEGLFVGGVPLSTSAPTGFDDATLAKTRMRIDPLSATIVMKDGVPVAALTVYGTGLHPADVQILDAVIARGQDAEDAVLEPRVGYYAFDHERMKVDPAKNSVDPRFDPALLCALKQRGFGLERSMPGMPVGLVDTGFPTLVTIAPGRLHGMTPDMSYIEGVAAGD